MDCQCLKVGKRLIQMKLCRSYFISNQPCSLSSHLCIIRLKNLFSHYHSLMNRHPTCQNRDKVVDLLEYEVED